MLPDNLAEARNLLSTVGKPDSVPHVADVAHAQALALIDIAESLRTIAEQGPGH
ncbi:MULTISPECIES: hypothetical protein [unclassified Mycobacterium]|uniref:hypothetical protein n=1 Tax=unclassified Mycobacterium TaxID=2642494 RepID=UPI0029C5FD0E|nr:MULTISPECIES: hypothetical protein [unclassified Mycobacterium]